ncbi:MAG: low molecular weight phosphotyrosine protein phosphatase [Candidatus Nitrohelix vancouverensis]|uniref:protein-tyrosine-phosphatase n=1 Tax=Candidatus Nitrohelix vancouverensis TaxID=2705534 RepID=A0A7T0C1Q7_9BACT|nr:MAG: low molecular weight phosphotyrosine protein phosphatase [Candidatus Nitrohelix vancouverensis]
METKTISVCFICLGNICRSPLAQGVFEDLIAKEGLENRILVSSAGVGDWHVGSPPDARMQNTARNRGITLNSRAQQIQTGDLKRLDLALAMDESNMLALKQIFPSSADPKKLRMFRSFDPQHNGDLNVPDPYYGGDAGFENVFDIVNRTCPQIIAFLKQEYAL